MKKARSITALLALLAIALFGAGSATGGAANENGSLVFGGLDPSTNTVQVYTLAPGSSPAKLTSTGAGVWHECPSWSPDGSLIYFDLYDRETESPAHIYRIDATGGTPQLSDRPNAPTHLCPSVDSTGKWVTAVQYKADNSNSIIRMRTDGSERRPVARAGKQQNVYSPQFAPGNSKRILFYRVTYKSVGAGVKRSDLVIVNGAGRKRNVTKRSNRRFGSASWSPNGRSIVAVRGSADKEIVRMSSKGTNVRRLIRVNGDFVHLSDPTFSPDGSKIAYVRCKGDCGDPDTRGNGSIWVMNADGSNRRRILSQATAGVQPVGDLDWGVGAP
jgi:Tol biopolymer transport system component